jgi:hypothetical protein
MKVHVVSVKRWKSSGTVLKSWKSESLKNGTGLTECENELC